MALFKQYRAYGQGRLRTVRKHGLSLKRRQQLPLLVAPAVTAACIGLALGFMWPVALALMLPALAWLGASLSGGLYLGFVARDVCTLAAGLAAATMHLAWSYGYWQGVISAALGPAGRVSN